jgi:AbrB family looped-hinge helix DNA binding protein
MSPFMKRPRSRITSQGQVSVPADVRRSLGLGPGTIIEWELEEGHAVVRRAGACTFEDLHRELFPDGPPARRSAEELDAGIRDAVRRRWSRARS